MGGILPPLHTVRLKKNRLSTQQFFVKIKTTNKITLLKLKSEIDYLDNNCAPLKPYFWPKELLHLFYL